MEHPTQVNLSYSLKNIPIPPANSYKKKLIEKVESLLKRMRWKALFFLKKDDSDDTSDTDDDTDPDQHHGLRSRRCPPQITELKPFEHDMLNLIDTIKLRNITDEFQDRLKKDIKTIKTSDAMYIPADKTRNLYKVNSALHQKLLRENITKTYQTADKTTTDKINTEAKTIAEQLGTADRMDTIAKRQAFITLKDHKENFDSKLPCRLINPAKSEIGLVSKTILDRINQSIRTATSVNQWLNSTSVIQWFQKLEDKNKHTFISFDIINFYPSITEKLLKKALAFAKRYTRISKQDIDIIYHCRKSLLFDEQIPWKKKRHNDLYQQKRINDLFDVTMGSYDGAEICDLIGLYILNTLSKKLDKGKIGLYRDDGLAVLKNTSGSTSDKTRKDIIKTFKELDLNITIDCNLKITNFLDVTLNLNNGKYCPYRKPNDRPAYIHKLSNHPPNITKNLPASISRRISDISYDKPTFDDASPCYNDALKSSGFTEKLTYTEQHTKKTRSRRRGIIWFNPPYSKNVSTNIGRSFLKLIDKHFPPESKLNKIFNRNTVKISYSCMPNVASIIKSHNKKISTKDTQTTQQRCNCRNKDLCPLKGNCMKPNIIYSAEVKVANEDHTKLYIGLTEPPFKTRFNNHKTSFKHGNHQNSTELSKYVWQLKKSNKPFDITWSIVSSARPYDSATKKCDLCLTEKLTIINADKLRLLNKRPELISKCRHENKFYLANHSGIT